MSSKHAEGCFKATCMQLSGGEFQDKDCKAIDLAKVAQTILWYDDF